MPISAQQWRLAVGQSNASHSLRLHVTGKPKMKLTIWNVLLFIFTVLLGAILLSEDCGRETGQRSEWWNPLYSHNLYHTFTIMVGKECKRHKSFFLSTLPLCSSLTFSIPFPFPFSPTFILYPTLLPPTSPISFATPTPFLLHSEVLMVAGISFAYNYR